MRLLAHIHGFPPHHCAGAEQTIHAMLRWLVTRGHDATVLYQARGRRQYPAYELEGVQVVPFDGRYLQRYYDADIILTHLDWTMRACRVSRMTKRPLVHLLHNDRQLAYHRVQLRDAALVVYNAQWLAEAVRWPGPSITVHPPVFSPDYETAPGTSATLINLTYAKGVEVFAEVARRLPMLRFLAVRGSYGEQHPEILEGLPNVEIADNDPDVRRIYERTRVLLMPSDYESWGRCAIEAAASGIPTIAHPTPGLVEALGPSGTFISRDRPDMWARALQALMHRGNLWPSRAAAAKRRAWEMDELSSSQLHAFERALEGLC